jgi:hypothetical protein
VSTRKPNEAEVMATTLPGMVPFDGWYCPNHPAGESLANEQAATHCWGCGQVKTDGGVPGDPMIAEVEP